MRSRMVIIDIYNIMKTNICDTFTPVPAWPIQVIQVSRLCMSNVLLKQTNIPTATSSVDLPTSGVTLLSLIGYVSNEHFVLSLYRFECWTHVRNINVLPFFFLQDEKSQTLSCSTWLTLVCKHEGKRLRAISFFLCDQCFIKYRYKVICRN